MSLLGEIEGILRPGLAFLELRCFANGGRVVIFREVGGSNAGQSDWAMQGAGAGTDSWAGGFGAESMGEEIAFNFGNVAQVPCPPR